MEDGRKMRQNREAHCLLAGLEGGIVGALVLLGWLALASAWYRRSVWTTANIMATTFYGEAALAPGFSSRTLAGLALYVVLYGIIGALFGLAVAYRLPGLRVTLIGVLVGLAWYYLSYTLVWRNLNPLITLYTHNGPMMAGHILYGGFLGRYPHYLATLAPGDAAARCGPVNRGNRRSREYLAERRIASINEAEWRELLQILTPISESYLRDLLRATGLPFAQPYAGIGQKSFDELERSLREMLTIYTAAMDSGDRALARYCRRQVIAAKDRARFLARSPKMEATRQAQKSEMAEWMIVWLENPAVFPAWVEIRKRYSSSTDCT